MSTKKISTFGVLVALAFIFSYIEALIPFNFAVPGMKLGLANIVVLATLYLLGTKEGFAISLLRVVLVGFTFGNLSTMIYSLAGGFLSFLVMALAKRFNLFSIIGVSVLGAIFHNVGQVSVAMIMVRTKTLIGYLPFLLVFGIVSGVVIGIVGGEITKRLKVILRY
ncbi:MAG: Gx transporter family protein [bacterium]|nr:Gx transporter family protein [bacterium]